MLRSDLCDYSDAYIVVKGNITIERDVNGDKKNKSLAFKNNAPFTSCVSKINNVLIENADDLYAILPLYNLLEYSRNYSKTFGSLWNYYRDEQSNGVNVDLKCLIRPINNTLNYLIDPTFTKVNRLFVLSFKNEEDRTFFSKYYVPSFK